jgi:HlyD family secretion protein
LEVVVPTSVTPDKTPASPAGRQEGPDPAARAVPAPSSAPPRSSRPLAEIIAHESARRRRRRATRWAIAAAVPFIILAAWWLLRPRPVPFAERFRTEPVTVGDVIRDVTATGNVEALTTVQVGAEISGRIASVAVDYNDRVRAGQVLARFDRTLLSAQLAQAEAATAAARAALEQARTTREKAAADSSRAVALWENKGLTDADRDAAVSAARLAAEAVSAAQAQLAAAEAAAAVARTNLDHTVIVSPIDGVIITRNVDPGQTVVSALQTPVLFTVAANLRKMRVVAAVDEADVGEVAAGQTATFTVSAYPDRVFHGVVTQVRNSPVVTQDVVTYGTLVEVDNPDLALKPGMTASVRIRIAAARDALRVPNAALSYTPPGGKAGTAPGVWVVAGSALRRVPVHPGISDGELTVVAPGDLKAGTAVVVGLTPGGRSAFGAGH